MKKKFIFAAMAALAMTASMSSCSNDNDPSNGYGNTTQENGLLSLVFNAQPNNALGTMTKATPVTSSNFYNTTLVPNMMVWGFFAPDVTEGNGITQGGQYVGAGGNGIVINNLSTTNPDVSKWDYNDNVDRGYWPKEKLNFQAIIPASDNSITSVAATVGASKLAHTVAEVTVPTEQSLQKDIMFAQVKNQTRTADANTPVDFTFDHAMSQVVFQGKTYADKISVEVESITVANADQKGKVGYLTDDGTDVALGAALADTRAYAKYAIGMASDATLDKSNMTTAKNLTDADGALIMLPQDRTGEKWSTTAGANVAISAADVANETYLAISCKVKNDNVYLIGGESAYETVYIPFEINWEQGKKYTYTLVFGKGQGGYDENGKPLDSMLPITYTVSAVNTWDPVTGSDVEF